jgi:excisionase family DNA binding protein
VAVKSPVIPRAQTVDEFCATWRLSRPSVYRLIGNGSLATVRVGRKRLILLDSAEKLFVAGAEIPLEAK